ncbi:hypothetical protein OG429_39510 [Streptomyces sp. NBC_00190]|uniref:hypothetical protein n=1 Tax=unclassified Streptomyces TaxID=2593676 RepID=UPI002E2B4376|nr:hypothetical protein [Streptomyces sp. NBC_00190]WSZ37631.1 hypothetical protein OG239_01310 [Streptomyces sp. NBC_00868]
MNESPRFALAVTLREIDALLGDERSRDEVIDLDKLSIDSGEAREVVAHLLADQELKPERIGERIVRRLEFLRESRRRPDGTKPSYEDIAASYGATRASLSRLVNRMKNAQDTTQDASHASSPRADTQAGIETYFFGEPNGWLSRDPATALNDALRPLLAELRAAAGQAGYGPRTVALRTAAGLPPEQWKLLEGLISTLERQVREERQGGR